MSLDDGLSKFLGGLYEAVYDPDRWRAAMTEIVQRSGSHTVVVASVDLRQRAFSNIQFHGREDSSAETGAREYAEEMSALDPALRWANQHPAAGLCETAAILPSEDHRRHEFIKWSKSRFGTVHWRTFYTEPVDDLSFSLAFHSSTDAGPPTRKQLPLHALLFENLERAVRLAARPPNFAADDSALIAADERGRPLSLSHRAEELLRVSDGLLIKQGVLKAQNADVDRLLQHAFQAAIDPTYGKLPGRGVRIARRRKPDLLVVVSRFPPSLDHLPSPTPAVLVRIIELEMRPGQLSEHSHLFGLTPRESEIACALLEGHSVGSLSEALGISRNTARNHLQVLFRKTHTNRQSDLVQMLNRLARH